MNLAGLQLNPIGVNFHLQKSLEIFDINSAEKIWSKTDKGWKVPSLMPIMVKIHLCLYQTILTIKFNCLIHQSFLRYDIFNDQNYQYFLWLTILIIMFSWLIKFLYSKPVKNSDHKKVLLLVNLMVELVWKIHIGPL